MTMETTFIPADELEVRTTADGSHELEGLCVPFGVTTDKAGPVPEMFVRGAFDDLDAARAKIRLTDENHGGSRRPVGVAKVLEQRAAGLWGRFRFYNTPEGRAAFENVTEETYGGLSIGFVATADRMIDGVRHVTRAMLHHVSLVDRPAYDDAVIVSVRSAADDYAWLRNPPRSIDIPEVPELTLLIARTRLGSARES